MEGGILQKVNILCKCVVYLYCEQQRYSLPHTILEADKACHQIKSTREEPNITVTRA